MNLYHGKYCIKYVENTVGNKTSPASFINISLYDEGLVKSFATTFPSWVGTDHTRKGVLKL